MLCYESVVKNIMDITLFFFLQHLLFLAVVGSNIIFYCFILTYMKLTPQ